MSSAPAHFEVVSDAEGAFEFVNRFFKVYRSEWQKGIVHKRDNEIIGAALYAEYNGSNVFIHLAGKPGRRWLSRDFLYWGLHYPFVQLGCRRITAWIEGSNADSRRFAEHVGFKLEATLTGAAADGGDILLYVLFREDCKIV